MLSHCTCVTSPIGVSNTHDTLKPVYNDHPSEESVSTNRHRYRLTQDVLNRCMWVRIHLFGNKLTWSMHFYATFETAEAIFRWETFVKKYATMEERIFDRNLIFILLVPSSQQREKCEFDRYPIINQGVSYIQTWSRGPANLPCNQQWWLMIDRQLF